MDRRLKGRVERLKKGLETSIEHPLPPASHTRRAVTLYCNVIICNTGFYGGSVCISPYKEPHKRVVYKQDGNNLFSTQIIRLPVKTIIEQQSRITSHDELKSLPPGFTSFTYSLL